MTRLKIKEHGNEVLNTLLKYHQRYKEHFDVKV